MSLSFISRTFLVVPTLFLVLAIVGCSLFSKPEPVELSGKTMGTTWRAIVIPESGVEIDASALQQVIEQRLVEINSMMSTYDPNSELSRFNQQKTTAWVNVSKEITAVVKAAATVSKPVSGAYDVTLGSLFRLWGFGPGAKPIEAKPELDQIFNVLNNVGYQLLAVSSDDSQLRKLQPDIEVDLSSIAKGFAVDQLGELFETWGIERYLVDIGGEVRTRGLSPTDEPWAIGIEWPANVPGFNARGLSVENANIATSGSYRNYTVVDGERVAHLIDGRTGMPITHNVASVTVLHRNAMLADAWATTLMILGLEEGRTIAQQQGIAASFTVGVGSDFRVVNVGGFDAYLYQ